MLKAVVGGMQQGVGRLVVQLAAAMVERQLGLCWLLCWLQQVLADPTCACLLLLPAMPPDVLLPKYHVSCNLVYLYQACSREVLPRKLMTTEDAELMQVQGIALTGHQPTSVVECTGRQTC